MAEVIATAGAEPATKFALEVKGVEKVFGNKGAITKALNGIDFNVAEGEFVAIMGPSGSGKSTLLNCIATIERVTAGTISVGGVDITRLHGKDLTRFRREGLGFVFQDGNLLDTLTGFENIALALTIRGIAAGEADVRVRTIAEALGVTDVLAKFPAQMSGGQRQRVAAARAMVGNPKLVLADEPTGALDSRNARIMMDTLCSMNACMGASIVMVTHDPFAASFSSRVVFVRDGRVFNEIRRSEGGRAELFDRIMEVQAFLGGEAHHDA